MSSGRARGGRARGGRARGGPGGGGGGPPAQGQPAQIPSHPHQVGGGIYLGDQPVPVPEWPEPDVKAGEDALVAATRGQMIDGFPARSGYGSSGDPIVLRTNYFKITPEGNDTLYRYDIEFSAELTRNKRKNLVQQLVQQPMFNNITWATDYGKYIVTTAQLNFGNATEFNIKLTVAPPPANTQTPQGPQGPPPQFVQDAQQRNTVSVRLKSPKTYSLNSMIQYLRSSQSGGMYTGSDDLIQMLNIVLCKHPRTSQTVAPVDGNKFYPFHENALQEISSLEGGLQALRGYFSSVRPAVGRLLLNLNVTSGAFYAPIPLIGVMNYFGPERQYELAAFVKGLKVEAKYTRTNETVPYMTKIKVICGLRQQINPNNTRDKRFANAKQAVFTYTDSNGTVTENSVLEYFQNVRGITLEFPNRPVLNVGTHKDPQYLPAELCTILPGQPYRALLPPLQTSNMIEFAARYPNQNAMSIAGTANAPGNGLKLFGLAGSGGNNVQQNTVVPFGLRIDTNMLAVPGRVLKAPKILYGSGKNRQEKDVRSGSWNLNNVKFFRAGAFNSWQIMALNIKRADGSFKTPLNPKPQNPEEILPPEQLVTKFETAIKGYGVQLGPQQPLIQVRLEPLTRGNRGANDRILDGEFAKAKQKGRIFLVLLPEKDRWLYSRIKYFGDVKFGVHTVNALGTNIQKTKGQEMFFANLALKFNVKGGGVAHEVPNTLVAPVANNTIIFGIDVTHPSPTSAKEAPSIACVVANTDATLFHWPGSIRTQAARQEISEKKTEGQEPQTAKQDTVDKLKEMVAERLRLWRKRNNNRLPERVVIYRDGVSEGQFKLVLEKELPSFQAAYKEFYGAEPKWPKTAIIIVGKRHHTRFYPTKSEDADHYYDQRTKREKGSWNTKPGTVVDRSIVGRVIREFYLQAHQGIQGTVRPAHYSVIKDDIGFTADQLERFTMNLCHYFARCTRAVSICPPAYYADLLAERGRAYLYTKLQENHADDSSSVSGSGEEWTGGVHPDIEESTWYM